jgi:hypothetical protein
VPGVFIHIRHCCATVLDGAIVGYLTAAAWFVASGF